MNVVNFGLVIDDTAFIIKQSAPSNYIYLLSYTTFDYRQALKELYPVADVKPDVDRMISTAQYLRRCLLKIIRSRNIHTGQETFRINKKYELDVSIQRIKHLESREIQLEDENLLDTKYKF